MDILILLVVLAAAFFGVKHKLRKTETPQHIETSTSHEAIGATTKADNTVEKDEAGCESSDQPIVNIEPSQTESSQSTEASSPAQIITESPAETSVKPNDQIPEDSAPKTQLAAESSISHSYYPTDSMLRRHYESMLAAGSITQSTDSNEAKIDIQSATNQPVEKQQIPEDSTLRRHFLTQLQAEIESRLYPRPTDSTLKRHYDSLVQAEISDHLADTWLHKPIKHLMDINF
ncbi:MAG: hypothetical protein ACXW1W_01465 [Methylococcaceae bacterium]